MACFFLLAFSQDINTFDGSVVIGKSQKAAYSCHSCWSGPIHNGLDFLGSVSIPSFETIYPK